MVYKSVRARTLGRSLPVIKLCWVPPPPPTPGHHMLLTTNLLDIKTKSVTIQMKATEYLLLPYGSVCHAVQDVITFRFIVLLFKWKVNWTLDQKLKKKISNTKKNEKRVSENVPVKIWLSWKHQIPWTIYHTKLLPDNLRKTQKDPWLLLEY